MLEVCRLTKLEQNDFEREQIFVLFFQNDFEREQIFVLFFT